MPGPARSPAGPDPVAPGDQQYQIKDAGAHPRVQQIAQLCTTIFEVPLAVAAVASGPTNLIFIQQVSKGWSRGQRPCAGPGALLFAKVGLSFRFVCVLVLEPWQG